MGPVFWNETIQRTIDRAHFGIDFVRGLRTGGHIQQARQAAAERAEDARNIVAGGPWLALAYAGAAVEDAMQNCTPFPTYEGVVAEIGELDVYTDEADVAYELAARRADWRNQPVLHKAVSLVMHASGAGPTKE
jgi:hypothetical protein